MNNARKCWSIMHARSDKTVARFGRLDVAVNNAATEGQVGPITDQTAESYAATFDTNVLGVLLSMKHEVRVMENQGSGNIVNISSTYGHKGAPLASVYVAAKHAVEEITKSVALEIVKSGIRARTRRHSLPVIFSTSTAVTASIDQAHGLKGGRYESHEYATSNLTVQDIR